LSRFDPLKMFLKYFCVVLFLTLAVSADDETPCYTKMKNGCGATTFMADSLRSGTELECAGAWGAFPRLNPETNELISHRLGNSMQYLLTASYFNEWDINRPGFNAYFNKLSDQEWDSGISLMIAMLKRGGKLNRKFSVELPDETKFSSRQNEMEALARTLDSEKETAEKTLKLIYWANHKSIETADDQSHRDPGFADYLAEGLNDVNVLRIKHLSNYVNMLTHIQTSGVDMSYAMHTFDTEILK